MKKVILCITAVVLALVLVLGGAFTAIKMFFSNGPVMDIKNAIQNNLKDGFSFEAEISYSDGKSYSATGAMLGIDLEELVLYESYFKRGDEIYYIDSDCLYINEGTTAEMMNLNNNDGVIIDDYTVAQAKMLAFDVKEMLENGNLKEIANFLNCLYGSDLLDESGFEDCVNELLKKLNDEDYLEENFGYKKKSKSGKTEITFEFEVTDVIELAVDEFKELSDAFVWEKDYEKFLESLESLEENFDSDIEIEVEFIIEDDHLVSALITVTQTRKNKAYETEIWIEFSDIGDAEVDSDVDELVSETRKKLGKRENVYWRENEGYYYINDNGEREYLH